MSMTYLQLASRLRQECGISGTGPTTVVSQTGELRRIVDWIATADEDIQRMYNEWKFMVGSFTLNTVASNGSYTSSDCVVPFTNLRDWRRTTFKCYLSSAGSGAEIPIEYIDYQDWYDIYNTGAQTDGPPVHFTIGNDMSIKFGPKPDGVYVVSGEYQKSVTTMTANVDVPVYPAEYHMAAVYSGMMKYGRYSGANEVYQDGKNELAKIMKQMRRTQLPPAKLGRPLA
jgi:hypothetical protein